MNGAEKTSEKCYYNSENNVVQNYPNKKEVTDLKKKSDLQKLLDYAGNFRWLTYASWVLSVISALLALVPFIYIWKIIKEVLDVAPNYENATTLTHNGIMAVVFAVGAMLVYIGALMCSHIAAFRVQANIRKDAMHHIATLPLGFMDGIGSGKMRKTVNEASAATETYLAHQLPDSAGAMATPIGLIALLLFFDWRLGLLSLVPVVLAFLIMSSMTGSKMKKKMEEYQNALDNMSNEAVEYVRGIPVVKTFGQSVFSFKKFKGSIDEYEKWVISYTKDMMLPMMGYTTIINAVFAVLIAAAMIFLAHGGEILRADGVEVRGRDLVERGDGKAGLAVLERVAQQLLILGDEAADARAAGGKALGNGVDDDDVLRRLLGKGAEGLQRLAAVDELAVRLIADEEQIVLLGEVN